uniref:Lipase member N n=2 Tax=Anthurium amnicola TaxID=1678845 RepID=A0A1D1ZHN3_9ARAE
MLRRFVDNVLAVAKESVKTFTYESLNNIVRLINGVSALLLALLPGKTSILEGIHGWELRPAFRGPRLPRWMENGVSSFNQFIHELSMDSDGSSSVGYTSAEEDDEDVFPASPLSQSSRLSYASSFSRSDRRLIRGIRCMFSYVMWPVTFVLSLPFLICHLIRFGRNEVSFSNKTTETESSGLHSAKPNHIKDHVVHRTTDRRRGVIEDLQLAIEIFIEGVFEIFHKTAHFLLSPIEAHRTILRWFTHRSGNGEFLANDMDVAVPTATLADDDPGLAERRTGFHQSLNTDARTCQDVIMEYGYPYESIQVVTSDGYILVLERIPRHDSKKVVYLQHGILDSSMGWVSNGVVGSPAFAAFDQGYDVFLGNLRGLVSREHVDKNISSRKYWRYSINEHGTQDIPAIIGKIHQVKTNELKMLQPECGEETDDQPYKLCTVCHSLGGAAMLMYVITCRIQEMPHRLSRLILLSPAGFHEDSTIMFTIVEHFILLFGPMLAYFIPALYIPTQFFRMLLNKLARDFHNYPALGGLVQTLMGYVAGGDSSNWVGVLGLPHYNMYDMPGLSLHVTLHLAQMKRARKFIMYDFGSTAANMKAYGSPQPLDLGQHYYLIDVPVDLVAGRKDQVIRPSMVKRHYRMMKRFGVEVSYNEFEYAHLDFTFSHREELLAYVMSRMMLVLPPLKSQDHQRSVRYRRANRTRLRKGGSDIEGTETAEIKNSG